jgi:hypothetical protein
MIVVAHRAADDVAVRARTSNLPVYCRHFVKALSRVMHIEQTLEVRCRDPEVINL